MRTTTGGRGFTYRQLGNVVTYSLLIVVTLLLTIPVIYLISTSLKSEAEYISENLDFFPSRPQWQNYYLALTMIDFKRFALNSFLLATTFATLTVITR
jgi:multiple sugar transport system permease protein